VNNNLTFALKLESRRTLEDCKSRWTTGGLECSCRYSNAL